VRRVAVHNRAEEVEVRVGLGGYLRMYWVCIGVVKLIEVMASCVHAIEVMASCVHAGLRAARTCVSGLLTENSGHRSADDRYTRVHCYRLNCPAIPAKGATTCQKSLPCMKSCYLQV
jgi:hypothetical protein